MSLQIAAPLSPGGASGPSDPLSPGASALQASLRTTALWVGDLAKDVTEADMYRLFSSVAPVLSIRVCRDQITSQSLGYGYVNYHTVEHAAIALTNLNFTDLHGKRIRIAASQRDPSRRRSNVGNIFIKNLPVSTDHGELNSTFLQFGPILSCKVAYDPVTGLSRRYGYVQFEKPEDAKIAVETVNGMLLGDSVVSVEFYQPKTRRTTDLWTNCYVKNIPLDWDSAYLQSKFDPFGIVTSCVVMSDPSFTPPKSRGFGFVCFNEHPAAEAAAANLNGLAVEPRFAPEEVVVAEGVPEAPKETKVLFVARAQSKVERKKELERSLADAAPGGGSVQISNLYLKHLSEDVTQDILSEEFTKYGVVSSCKIMTNDDGSSRGFGFITMSTAEEATHALNEMHKKAFYGKILYVAIHEPRERRAQKIQQFRMQLMRGQLPGFPGMMQPPMGMDMAGGGVSFMQPPVGYGYAQPMPFGGQGMGGWGGPRPQYNAPFGGQPGRGGRGGGMGPRRGGYSGEPRGMGMGGGSGGGVRFATPQGPISGMPPQPPQQMMAPPQQMRAGPLPPQAPQRPWYEALDTMSAEDRMEFLGNRLYPLIHQRNPDLAPKFTGMMLQLPPADIISLIDSPQMLSSKLEEAIKVLESEQWHQ